MMIRNMVNFEPHTLRETNIITDNVSLYTYSLRPQQLRKDNLTAVILHGGGESTSTIKYDKLAQLFADNGVAVICLDFVGHGKTGGAMTDNSLALRVQHAQAAIEHWTTPKTPLILVGFSMSGHTAMRLVPRLGKRVKSVGLICSATYAAEAEEVSVGPDFTQILRTPESWRSSLGLRDLADFTGKTMVITGNEDTVVGWEITVEIIRSAKTKSKELRVEVLGGVDHHLAIWLSEHKAFSEQVVHYLAEEML